MLPTSTALVSDADNTLAGLPQSAGNEIFFASRAGRASLVALDSALLMGLRLE